MNKQQTKTACLHVFKETGEQIQILKRNTRVQKAALQNLHC